MRILAQATLRFVKPRRAQKAQGALPGFGMAQARAQAQVFRKLRAHAHHGVEGRGRVLKNHGYFFPAQAAQFSGGTAQYIHAIQQYLAARDMPGFGQYARDGAGQRRFAAAGFAHHAQHAAALHLKGHAVHGAHFARAGGIGHAQAVYL